jgi:hypothetical protein
VGSNPISRLPLLDADKPDLCGYGLANHVEKVMVNSASVFFIDNPNTV